MADDKDKDSFLPKYKQPSYALRLWGKLTPAADNIYAISLCCAIQAGVGVLMMRYPRKSFKVRYGKWPYRAARTLGIMTGVAVISGTVVPEYYRMKHISIDPWAMTARADRIKALKEGKKVSWWWGAHDHKPLDFHTYAAQLEANTEKYKKLEVKESLAEAAESGFRAVVPMSTMNIWIRHMLAKYLPKSFTGEKPFPHDDKVVKAMFEDGLKQSHEQLVAQNRKFRDGVQEQAENPGFLAHRKWLFGSTPSVMDAAMEMIIEELQGEVADIEQEAGKEEFLRDLYDTIAKEWDGSIMWAYIAHETDSTIRLIPTTTNSFDEDAQLVEEVEDEE